MNEELLHPKVAASLHEHQIAYRSMACDPDLADTAAFCEHYDIPLEASANTIIIASRTEPAQYCACVVLATTKLDVNKKVRALMGTRKLSFASGEQTVALTDMQIGGVTIFGLPTSLPIYVDQAVMEQPEVVMGGGNRSSKLALDPTELRKLPSCKIIEQLAIPKA